MLFCVGFNTKLIRKILIFIWNIFYICRPIAFWINTIIGQSIESGEMHLFRKPTLDESWIKMIGHEFEQTYMAKLRDFLSSEKSQGKKIYPPGSLWFEAFNRTPFEQVKVVILGQDPYHGPHQAHGLCFSSHWADQGVLLLNATLTVEAHKAGSHQHQGWEEFTDAVIHALNQNAEHLVFMLWGSYAQKKGAKIDQSKHLVLKAPHPSPLSAYRGFLGCQHFSKANRYLESQGKIQIEW